MNNATQGPKRNLLIVDDSKVSRLRIQSYFATVCPHWEIREAGSGDEALVISETFQPDYVTMDVNMPGISGYEAAQKITAGNPKLRIVMLTANIQESSKQMASDLNLHFVAKPIVSASLEKVHQYFKDSE